MHTLRPTHTPTHSCYCLLCLLRALNKSCYQQTPVAAGSVLLLLLRPTLQTP
jgi:hypothetical protein